MSENITHVEVSIPMLADELRAALLRLSNRTEVDDALLVDIVARFRSALGRARRLAAEQTHGWNEWADWPSVVRLAVAERLVGAARAGGNAGDLRFDVLVAAALYRQEGAIPANADSNLIDEFVRENAAIYGCGP